MTNKISKSTFTKEWGEGQNKTFYHEIQFEGDSKKYNIGAKTQNPSFLAVGQSLEYEFKDEAKGSIKRAKPAFGGSPAAQTNLLDIKVSTGLIAATILYAGGKITKEQINDLAANVARKFDEVKAMLV